MGKAINTQIKLKKIHLMIFIFTEQLSDIRNSDLMKTLMQK